MVLGSSLSSWMKKSIIFCENCVLHLDHINKLVIIM